MVFCKEWGIVVVSTFHQKGDKSKIFGGDVVGELMYISQRVSCMTSEIRGVWIGEKQNEELFVILV